MLCDISEDTCATVPGGFPSCWSEFGEVWITDAFQSARNSGQAAAWSLLSKCWSESFQHLTWPSCLRLIVKEKVTHWLWISQVRVKQLSSWSILDLFEQSWEKSLLQDWLHSPSHLGTAKREHHASMFCQAQLLGSGISCCEAWLGAFPGLNCWHSLH